MNVKDARAHTEPDHHAEGPGFQPRELVLLGAGHAHVNVLAALAAHPLIGVRIILVAPHPRQMYSGMVPGFVAGHYPLEDCVIPLEPLVRRSGVRWLQRSVKALDAKNNTVQLDDGSTLRYDWLSVNTGSVQNREHMDAAIPGARTHGLFVRPIEAFSALWPRVVEMGTERALRIAVIGAGAAGVELAMAIRHRFPQSAVTLVTGDAAVEQSIKDGNVRLGGMQSEIDRLHREIAALGAVNLAAVDELASASQRKEFLDAQNADLTEAMKTLEDAIRKIDAETRDMLSGTFDQVNQHFGRMFPELFGGGNARLVITGDEILDSGVQVIAQPPGKKNQTIHLLSGGEKALTAIALVFAIFQLNPAPFCLLDEVDAPLDDANTERYAKLVRSMSKETQFLFISHNKIAMEMAEQLIGVTMQEQGVSRIVAVDMESALTLAELA
jgi:hypothetical protein